MSLDKQWLKAAKRKLNFLVENRDALHAEGKKYDAEMTRLERLLETTWQELAGYLLPDIGDEDLFGGVGAKVNLYDHDRDGQWDRAKADLDRDGQWGEKYTLKAGTVERKVVATQARFKLRQGAWAPAQ